MLPADETQALAGRARTAARAVVGLVLEEERAARFVHGYTLDYRRLGIAGEAEHKRELLDAVERESLLLVAARIERTLPRAAGARFSRQAEAEAVAGFRQAFLTFLGGSLAWDNAEREAFRRDLGMYLRLATREARRLGPRRGHAPAAGAFVDRCAFLVDPSMMAQARQAAARYQAELESCADQALRAAFRGFRGAPRRPATRPKRVARRKSVPRRKPTRRGKPASRSAKKRPASSSHGKASQRRKSTPRPKSSPRRKSTLRRKSKPGPKSPVSAKSRRRPRRTPTRPRR